MSASREKKQRQSAGPDQKALKAQQEQAARKKKTIVYSVVGALAAVLVIALLVWRTGFFQARASAATVGNETLSAAQLSYYYYGARNDFANSYGSIFGFDSSVSDDKQSYMDGSTYREYFMQTALSNAQFSFALEQEAISAGHTEDEIKDVLEANIASAKASATNSGLSYSAYLRAVYGSYMSSSVFERELTRTLMASLVYNEKYEEAFDSYVQADLEDYYKENADTLDTIEYSSLYFPIAKVDTTNEDGSELPEDEVTKLEEQAKADAKEKAEEALEAVESGSTFQSQIDKYELTGSYNTDHNTVVGTSYIGSAFREQLLALGKDECDLVETDTGYYVVSFHDRYLEDAPTQDVRHILALAESTTDTEGKIAITEEAWAAAKERIDAIEAEWNAGAKTEDSFAALANEKSDDGDGTTGGLYDRIDPSDSYVSEFLDWIFADGRKPGDTGIVQHSAEGGTSGYSGYHFMYLVGDNEPLWMRSARSALASAARTEWTDGIFANYATAELSGASRMGR